MSTGESTAASAPIAPGGVLLHIGPPKTASTAIQNALHGQREELARLGVRYAGKGYRPREAGWAVLGIGSAVGRPAPRIEKWHRIVEEIHQHPDKRICLSSEDFARATDEAAARIVADIGVERVHLVHVVRRFDRLLPSLWQERVKARLTSSYDAWLEVVLAEESDRFEWRNLWIPHNVAGILERWGRVVPAERITLICSDDSDRQLLPGAFESLLGLPPGLLSSGELARSNRSLTGNEVELLRRLNEVAAAEKWSPEEYLHVGQLGIIRGFRHSDPSPTDHKIPPVPDWARERIAEFSRRQVEAVRSSGAQVIGNPDALLPQAASDVPPDDAVTSVAIDTAVTAVLGAIHGSRKLSESTGAEVRKRRRKPRRAGDRPASELSTKELARILASRAKGRLKRG